MYLVLYSSSEPKEGRTIFNVFSHLRHFLGANTNMLLVQLLVSPAIWAISRQERERNKSQVWRGKTFNLKVSKYQAQRNVPWKGTKSHDLRECHGKGEEQRFVYKSSEQTKPRVQETGRRNEAWKGEEKKWMRFEEWKTIIRDKQWNTKRGKQIEKERERLKNGRWGNEKEEEEDERNTRQVLDEVSRDEAITATAKIPGFRTLFSCPRISHEMDKKGNGRNKGELVKNSSSSPCHTFFAPHSVMSKLIFLLLEGKHTFFQPIVPNCSVVELCSSHSILHQMVVL